MILERPRIKRTTQRVDKPNGDVYLLRPSAELDVCIEAPSEVQRRILDALDGTRRRADLEGEFGEEALAEVLTQLGELGLVEDAADDDLIDAGTMARFDRQLRYFSDVSSGQTPSETQRKLAEARVAVLGAGGLGSWSALALSCCGIGEMRLVDFDRVEMSNLNRQVLYAEAEIGKPKAQLAAKRLRAFNGSMRVDVLEQRLDSEDAVAAAIEGYDLVVDAVDWPAHEIEVWVNSACFAAGIPYIAMSHFPPVARVGPFYIPGRTGCYACQEIAFRREYPLYDLAVEQQRAKPSPAATLGPACALIGSHVALDAMHFITGLAEPSTLGASTLYDLRTMETTREPVVRDESCSVCAS
jgi:bacteriocin biosynthesis cyclodehydratase domain-containing protein